MLLEKNSALLKFTANQASTLEDVASSLRSTKAFVIAGKSFGVISSVVGAIESATDDDGFTWGDGVKLGIGIVSTFTPLGWAHAAADLGTGLITGTTLTDRIGQSIDHAIEQ